MPTLDIALLRSFIAVARAGSIRAAAGRIGRTQSAISLQIKRLEEIVGDTLFHRTGTGLVLTLAGERFVLGADRILAAHDETVEGLKAESVGGSIAFGCPEDYLTAFFPDLLRRYGRANPGIELEIICAPTMDLHPLLQKRRIDLALVSLPVVPSDTAAVDIRARQVIRTEPLVWIASEASPVDLTEGPVPLALSAPGTLDHVEARKALDASGIAYRVAHASNGLAGLLAIARSGLAISVATRAAVPTDLHTVSTGLPVLPEIGISLAFASARPTKPVRSFGRFVSQELARD
ncbi:LysR family transcriptional regulator [Epibacterium sp. Ofav1-8]|uniref:LysR family transcriptional regulator n=1 Tax=Epibacterium sp. Ofav1-8 TaxID=2917735 RepID=UPI001EF434B7|nr:LysR family transcriptional regulator [Epibacterium sp. Ofav1-8]MCG7625047.1 LysR family transcriptional regulator [Epibacterium sp. Ofav1-8]